MTTPTRASEGQQLGVLALAVLNGLLLSGAWGAAATRGGVVALAKVSPLLPPLLLRGVLPFLSLYAAAYAVVPAVRAVAAAFKNSTAAKQNEARRRAALVRLSSWSGYHVCVALAVSSAYARSSLQCVDHCAACRSWKMRRRSSSQS